MTTPPLKLSGLIWSGGKFKPGGSPVIDWTNPITLNMVGYWYLGDGCQRGNLVDGTIVSSITGSFTNGLYGPQYQPATTAATSNSTNALLVKASGGYLAGSPNFSICSLAVTTGSTNPTWDRAIYSERGSSATADIIKLAQDSQLGANPIEFTIRDDASTLLQVGNTSTTIGDGLWHAYGVSKLSTQVNLYKDGAVLVSTTWVGTNNFTNTIATRIGCDSVINTKSWIGSIAYVAIWKRSLSAQEQLSMALNPYQVLAPQEYGMPLIFGGTIIPPTAIPVTMSPLQMRTNFEVLGY